MAWTQTTYGFETVTSTVTVSGSTATLSGTGPYLRFTDSDAGHEDWRINVDADLFEIEWLSGTGPDVWTDVMVFSDPAAAARTLTLTDYALYFTGLDAAQVFLRAIVSSEANPRFRIDTNGKLEWGAGGASAVDTALERTAAAILSTATIRGTVAPSNAADLTRKDYVDTADATKLALAGGSMTGFITLHAAPTANMHAATKLYVDSFAGVATSGGTMTGTLNFDLAVAGNIVRSFVASDANSRFTITSAGVISWGAGGASAVDTSISRSAANTLTMAAGDQFQVIGGTESLPGLAISGDANTGLRSSGADTLEIVTAGADRWQVTSAGHILAVDDNTVDIGSTTTAQRPRAIYARTSVTTPTIGVDADSLHTLPDVTADTIALLAASQVFTNKAGTPYQWMSNSGATQLAADNTTRYLAPSGVDTPSTTEANHYMIVAHACQVTVARGRLNDAPPGGAATRTLTLRKNGADTTMVLSFGAADSTAVSTTAQSFAAGDLISWGSAGASNPAATKIQLVLRIRDTSA